MRRIPVALLTFVIGVAGAALWQTGPPPSLSLCDLSRSIAGYEGKRVRVRGELYLGHLGSVRLLGSAETAPGSGRRECAESAEVYFREEPELIGKIRELNGTWMHRGGSAKAEVVLSGRFEGPQDPCPNAGVVIRDAVLESASLQE